MPAAQPRERSRELMMAVEFVIGQNAPKIEVHKAWMAFEEKLAMRHHLLEGHEQRREFGAQGLFLLAPAFHAVAPELALLVPAIGQLLRARHELLEVGIIQTKGVTLHV